MYYHQLISSEEQLDNMFQSRIIFEFFEMKAKHPRQTKYNFNKML